MSSAERCVRRATNLGPVVLALLVVARVGFSMPAQPQSSQENPGPAFQLYSWGDANGDWNFSILPDTNRQKTVAEVFNPKVTLKGLEQLKRKLSAMPTGSHVVWFDRLTLGGAKVKGSESLKYPPDQVVAEIRQHAQTRSINIVGPPTPTAAQ